MRLKALFALAFVLAALAGAQTVRFDEDKGENLPDDVYTVVRVIDADTFVVEQRVVISTTASGGAPSGGALPPAPELVQRSVRVIGVDSPEARPAEPYHAEATAFAREVLAGQPVVLIQGKDPVDRYGRALAYVYPPLGLDYALMLAQAGFAELYTQPPNNRHAELYAAAVEGARSTHKGMWAGSPARFVDRNCSYFQTQVEAQAFFLGARTPNRRDPHRLDPDRNAEACQNLP